MNPGSGSGEEARDLERTLTDRLTDVRAVELSDPDLTAEVDRAVGEGRAVVAAGGDGTANAVAQHVVGRGIMAVLPLGTLNHFGRDLGLRDIDHAIDVLKTGPVRRVDVGRVGDRFFLNNAGIGLYPEMVYRRDQAPDRTVKWLAAAGASIRVMRDSAPVTGTIEADGDQRALLAWMVFVGNNRFGTTPGRIGQRDRLDEGVLDVGLFLAGPRGSRRSSVAWRVFRSRPWQTSRRVVRRTARRVSVRLEGEPRQLSFDGETSEPVRAMDAEIVPGELRVVVPPDDRG
ncbi:MAG TPA: diacylglycerol kinase family protein [Actinomycetota bacterium]|nr:diacylglycerol kinase family protein [Actinomycetota bacterium]